MVAKTGSSTDAVAALQALAERPYEFDFYSAMRLLECMNPDKPRFGEGARPIDEPVRVTQEPSLIFAPSTLTSFKPGGGSTPHRLSAYFFGLFGPHGPLPLHLTEYVREREFNHADPTLRSFADIFHHRMMLLFYRAWANANPATSLDRAGPRRFDTYVGSMFGIGSDEFRGRDAVPDEAKYFLSGLLGLKTRPASAVIAMLEEFIELPFELEEFSGTWLPLAEEDWSKLGARRRASTLGIDTLLGSAVWACQQKFRLVCGPIGYADFKRLLPGREALKKLSGLIRNYLGDEFDWDLNLILFANEVPSLRLGQSGELGWTSWLGQRQEDTDADEVIIHPASSAH